MSPTVLTIARDAVRPGRRFSYGPHRDQCCELRLPSAARFPAPWPTAIVIHGGYWQNTFSKLVMRPVCADLTRRGWATWNIEYRRLGGRSGGGWPMTFDDVAAAIDRLGTVDAPLDTSRLVVIGHSAGGHLALWAAGRAAIPDGFPGADPSVRPVAAVALAPVANLERGTSLTRPGGVGRELLGGGPDEVPERYAIANPQRMVPLPVAALLVHSPQDATVPIGQSREYVAATEAAGGRATLIETSGTHRDQIDPRSPSWTAVTAELDRLVEDAAVSAPSA